MTEPKIPSFLFSIFEKKMRNGTIGMSIKRKETIKDIYRNLINYYSHKSKYYISILTARVYFTVSTFCKI